MPTADIQRFNLTVVSNVLMSLSIRSDPRKSIVFLCPASERSQENTFQGLSLCGAQLGVER